MRSCFYFQILIEFLSSAALANQERWYKPPVVKEIEYEEEEYEGDEEERGEGEEEGEQPPSKKANVDTVEKGTLPGSYPGNVNKN